MSSIPLHLAAAIHAALDHHYTAGGARVALLNAYQSVGRQVNVTVTGGGFGSQEKEKLMIADQDVEGLFAEITWGEGEGWRVVHPSGMLLTDLGHIGEVS